MQLNSPILLIVLFVLAMLPAPILFLVFWRLRRRPIDWRRRWAARLMVAIFGLTLAILIPIAIVRRDAMTVIPFAVFTFTMWAIWNRKFNPRVVWAVSGLVGVATAAYGGVTTAGGVQEMIAKPLSPVWAGWGIAALLALMTWVGVGAATFCIWMARRARGSWEQTSRAS